MKNILFLSMVSAKFGEWVPDMSCDTYGQPLLNKLVGTAEGKNHMEMVKECEAFCASTSDDFPGRFTKGDPLCCSHAHWEDGETNCYLYMGKAAI